MRHLYANPWSPGELLARRSSVIERVSSITGHKGRMALLMKGVDPILQCGVPIPTRQKSYFRYLTGCQLPSASFLLETKGQRMIRSQLFFNRRTPSEQMWDGVQESEEELSRKHVLTDICPSSSLSSTLDRLSCDRDVLFIYDPLDVPEYSSILSRSKVEPLSPHLDALRLVKSPCEENVMREAGRRGALSLASAISSGQRSEAAFGKRLEWEYARRGCDGPAYPPVVACGERACTVHYLSLEGELKEGESVLVDAGAEVDGYLSDISRCFPVSGQFSPPQKALYDALETVQLSLIEEARQGDLVLNSLFQSMLHLLGEVMEEVGIFKRSMSTTEKQRVVDNLSLHHVGHYLGLDVHDSPSVPRNITMPRGTVFTIEPGIYIRKGDPNVKEEFHGIGMRIEDDLLVTSGSTVEVLTHHCPKSIQDIQFLANLSRK